MVAYFLTLARHAQWMHRPGDFRATIIGGCFHRLPRVDVDEEVVKRTASRRGRRLRSDERPRKSGGGELVDFLVILGRFSRVTVEVARNQMHRPLARLFGALLRHCVVTSAARARCIRAEQRL